MKYYIQISGFEPIEVAEPAFAVAEEHLGLSYPSHADGVPGTKGFRVGTTTGFILFDQPKTFNAVWIAPDSSAHLPVPYFNAGSVHMNAGGDWTIYRATIIADCEDTVWEIVKVAFPVFKKRRITEVEADHV
jgi:hypothetical protein